MQTYVLECTYQHRPDSVGLTMPLLSPIFYEICDHLLYWVLSLGSKTAKTFLRRIRIRLIKLCDVYHLEQQTDRQKPTLISQVDGK